LIFADYAVADPAGRLTVVGGGITGLGMTPNGAFTTPFSLFVSVSVPPHLYNAECAVEIALLDSADGLVSIPGPAPGLPEQPMRIGQAIRFAEPNFAHPVAMPNRFIYARTQWVLSFPTGLPLMQGEGYSWQVKLDDETRDDWHERFVVLGPIAGPVLG
jgi:hypothetical protein